MLDFRAQSVPLPAGRRERQKLERRRRIEDAARAVFAEKGYEGATTREVAARADVSIGTLFAYAPDKRALLAMVFRDALHALTERTFATIPPAPLLDQLMHVFGPRFEFWGADPALARHAVRETIALAYDGERPPELFLADGLLTLVRTQQRDGTIDATVDATRIVRLILDIYLSENRGWLAEDDPSVATGLRNLRATLELALCGITSGRRMP